MHKHRVLALSLVLGLPVFAAQAAELSVAVEVPRLQVAEYHRPYVAVWLEDANQRHVADLSVWYDLKMKDKEGEKWLKDLRQWWRRSGRSLELPVDGISAATRPVGVHTLVFPASHPALGKLGNGQYQLVVEAAREVGGRELVKIPFSWPATTAETLGATGSSELGKISLTLKP